MIDSVHIKFGAVKALPWDGEQAPQIWLIYSHFHAAKVTHPDCDYSFSCMTLGWSDWRFDHVYEDIEIGFGVISAIDPHGIDRHYWSVRFGHDGDPAIDQWGGTFTLHNRFYDGCIDPERVEAINDLLDSAWMAEGMELWPKLQEANGGPFDTAPRDWLLLEIENRCTIFCKQLFISTGFGIYAQRNQEIAKSIITDIEDEITDYRDSLKSDEEK